MNTKQGFRLRIALAALLGALAGLTFFAVCVMAQPRADLGPVSAFEVSDIDARDKPASPALYSGQTMPFYLQDDPQWAQLPYAGGTIGDSGCGLACAAMAIEFMTTQRTDPRTLADAVGDACLTAGVNDPGKFCAWIADHYADYGISHTDIYFNSSDALRDVRDGKMVFASLSGDFGERSYGGHIVLLWRSDGSGIWVRDPMSGANSQTPLTDDEFHSVNWVYFYSISGGNYDTQRH